MSDQERFLIRIMAVVMGLIVLTILGLIGFVVWQTGQDIKRDEADLAAAAAKKKS